MALTLAARLLIKSPTQSVPWVLVSPQRAVPQSQRGHPEEGSPAPPPLAALPSRRAPALPACQRMLTTHRGGFSTVPGKLLEGSEQRPLPLTVSHCCCSETNFRGETGSRETCSESPAVQVRGDGFDQDCGSGGAHVWLHSGYIFNIKPTGLSSRNVREREESRITPRPLAEKQHGWRCHRIPWLED